MNELTIDSKEKLNAAFEELKKIGYFAEQDFWCCNTCALADIPNDVNKFVFYHKQAADELKNCSECHIGWDGDGKEICAVFEKHGITTQWDGDPNRKILITVPN